MLNTVIANLVIEGPDWRDNKTYVLKIVISGKNLTIAEVQADSLETAGYQFAQQLGKAMEQHE